MADDRLHSCGCAGHALPGELGAGRRRPNMMQRLTLLMAASLFVLSACGGDISPLRTLPPGPEVPPAEPLPDGRFRVPAGSGPVDPGVPYAFTINGHCGLEEAVIDFDGSLWNPTEPVPQVDELGADPLGSISGRMTLDEQNRRRAEFRSDNGASFILTRAGATADTVPCD